MDLVSEKKENIEISVIIPVYNVEEYLERCIESILAQTFSKYEMVLVDDGSTDLSGNICDKYSEKYNNIKVVHQENAGLSAARNTGIEHSIAEKIIFVDSDDYITKDALQKLNNLIEKTGADIAVGGTVDVYGDYKENHNTTICKYEGTGKEIFGKLLAGWGEVPGSACGKLYKRDAIGDNRFPVGKIFEDAFFLPKVMIPLPKIVGTSEPLYIYWHRPDSITTSRYTKRSMQTIEAYEYTLKVVKEDAPELLPQARRRLLWAYYVVLDMMLAEKNYKKIEDYPHVVAYLKKNWFKVIKNPYFGIGRKIAAFVLKINVGLYRKIAIVSVSKKKV